MITYLPTTFLNKIEKYKIYYSDETILKNTMINIINWIDSNIGIPNPILFEIFLTACKDKWKKYLKVYNKTQWLI